MVFGAVSIYNLITALSRYIFIFIIAEALLDYIIADKFPGIFRPVFPEDNICFDYSINNRK